MPDMSQVPAGVPPQDYSDFITAQRQQMLANALMQGSMTPIQQPQTTPVKGLYVQPRVGALQGVSKVAEALLGNSAAKQAMQSQVKLQQALNQAYAPGGQQTSPGTPLQAAPPPSDPDEQSVQPAIARAPGQSLATTVQQTQPTTAPVNPRNPYGLPADVARQLAMSDPAKYAAYLQGPEWAQQARAANIDPGTAARALLAKQTAQEVRPGATMIDPISGRTIVGADPSKGEFYAVGPNGQVVAMPIQNDAQLQAIRAGLTTAATQANTPREIPMGGGVSTIGYPPTPPALRAPQQQPPAAPAPAGQSPAPPGAAPVAGPAPGAAAPGAAGPTLPGPPRPPGTAQAPPAPQATGFWSSMPKLQIPVTPGQTSNTYQQKNLEAASAKNAELSTQYGQQSALADQQLDLNRRALAALPNAEVGPMSEWLTTNRARLIEAFPSLKSLIPESGSVTPTMELNKELLNSALQGARQIYGNRMTQNEVKLQTEEMSPSSHMTADAIQSLVAQGNVQALYSKQRATDYNTFTRRGGDPLQFEAWYAQQRPLSEFAAMQQMSPAQRQVAMQRFSQNPGSRADFKNALGWDPVNWQ
jgi:hypothetical protein